MRHFETTFQGEDGLTLYAQQWLPDDDCKAVLAIVHGIGEHSGRYANVVNAMVAAGIGVGAFDLRGHGKSEGERGHIDRWAQYRADVGHHLDWVLSWSEDKPAFLFGHSLGSTIVAEYVMREDVSRLQGVLLSGLALNPAAAVEPYLITLSKVLSRVLPKLALSTGLDVDGLSRDRKVVQAYRDDPLVHPKASTRFGTELMNAADYVREHPEAFDAPALVFHGQDDPINDVKLAERFFEGMASKDKTLKIYTGMLHECHNELGYETVVGDMVNWIAARL